MVDIEGGGTIPPTCKQDPPWTDPTSYETREPTSPTAIAVGAFVAAILALAVAVAALTIAIVALPQ